MQNNKNPGAGEKFCVSRPRFFFFYAFFVPKRVYRVKYILEAPLILMCGVSECNNFA